MIQYKQPKKVKGARKKARKEVVERLMRKYPTCFEGKSDKEIRNIVTAFRLSGKSDDAFPNFYIGYKYHLETLLELDKCRRTNNYYKAAEIINNINKDQYDPLCSGHRLFLAETPEFMKNNEE